MKLIAYPLPSSTSWAIDWLNGGMVGTKESCKEAEAKFAAKLASLPEKNRQWAAQNMRGRDIGI